MTINSIKLKLRRPITVPFSKKSIDEKKGIGFHYKGRPYLTHTSLAENETALRRVTFVQILLLIDLVLAFLTFALINLHAFLVFFIGAITFLYFTDVLFYLFLSSKTLAKDASISIENSKLSKLTSDDLPIYTVLCPLYKEWKVIPQFINSIKALDYPKEKLQVILLLEEDDEKTISEVSKMTLPDFFEVAIVPDSLPKTKPKALNFGLLKTKGEYLVVYDAEDIPEPLQLKKAFLAFKNAPSNIFCIQAKLNYYNPYQNLLTRLFSMEYSLWFGLVLPGLQSIGAPIPLGGTSNHFRTKNISMLLGWDPFNVTEDADLGIRLFKRGYKTEILNSTTYEEANSDLPNWIKQRTRWIKGYLQTYLVHLRRPKELAGDLRNPHIITFHLLMGGKMIFLLINPILWTITPSYFIFRSIIGAQIDTLFPSFILYAGTFTLIIGNFMYLYMYSIILAKKQQWNLIPFMVFMPFYWLLMSFASFLALIEFVVKPHHWNKTRHGLHMSYLSIYFESSKNAEKPIAILPGITYET